jgi:hypothetical protein
MLIAVHVVRCSSLQAYEPLNIGPQLDETGPIMAPLIHHTAPDILGCQAVPKGTNMPKPELSGQCRERASC